MRVSARTQSETLSEPEASSDHEQNSSGSGSGSGSGGESDDDKQDMLDALEAYNRSMLGMGVSPTTNAGSVGKGKGKARDDGDDSAEEIQDFGAEFGVLGDMMSGSEDSEDEDDDESGELYDEDDDFEGVAAPEPLVQEIIPTVVYADTAAHTHAKVSKADYKRFMASTSAWLRRNAVTHSAFCKIVFEICQDISER